LIILNKEFLNLTLYSMKVLFTGLFVGLILSSATAQKDPMKFGNIPMEDMTMISYGNDSSASAVILADYGEAYIQSTALSANMTFERHIRIKILKKDGTLWANAIIPLYKSGSSEEKVTNLKASTYNLENGKIIESKMSKDGIFKTKFNRNIVHQKFTLPDVKEGSVIEYAYKISSDFLSNFPNWEFQKTIPTRSSEYWAIIPDFFIFEKYMQGYVPVSSYDVKSMNVGGIAAKGHHYISKNVPAFKEEPYMTSESDYLSKINFALSHISFPGEVVQEIMGSWEKLNDLLLQDEDFYGVIKGSGFLKSKVAEITAGLQDPLQKITALHNYVKENIEWDGYTDFYAGSLKKVIETKTGSSGDINLLLASMLEKAGFNIDMVLVSTRDHGFVRQPYPMARQFNYVVCAVRLADKTILLDATEKQLPVNVLPERCLNGQGLVISSKNFGWIPLDTKTKSKTVVSAELSLDESGILKGQIVFTRDGYDATRMRNAYLTKGQDEYLKDEIAGKAWVLEKSEFKNIKEITAPSMEKHEVSISDHVSLAGDNMYFSPFVTSQIEINPFKSEERVYPVDYGSPIEKVYLCKIKVPQGYVIDEAPASKIFMLPGNAARFLYNVSATGDWISITSNFQVNRNIFDQTEYPNLREFYNQVVAKEAEQIVFKKKI
jgi:hypothetical protein